MNGDCISIEEHTRLVNEAVGKAVRAVLNKSGCVHDRYVNWAVDSPDHDSPAVQILLDNRETMLLHKKSLLAAVASLKE